VPGHAISISLERRPNSEAVAMAVEAEIAPLQLSTWRMFRRTVSSLSFFLLLGRDPNGRDGPITKNPKPQTEQV
jgi:hypothetical protein